MSNDILVDCVECLKRSVSLLNDSLEILDETTKNVPRLKKVLKTRKVFGLVPDVDLDHASKTLIEELQPQIQSLSNKMVGEMSKLRKKRDGLARKIELQHLRLESIEKSKELSIRGNQILNSANLDAVKLERYKILKDKRERMNYSLSRRLLQLKRTSMMINDPKE